MPKGGARREKVPEVDLNHLADSLVCHVKAVGLQGAFALGKYLNLERQQAVVGQDLVDLLPLIKSLCKVEPSLQFKYSDLSEVLKQILKDFPGIKDSFPLSMQGTLWKTLADALLVVRNHCRRIGRDKAKYLEAGKKLSHFQLEKLEEIWAFFNEPAGQGSSPRKVGKKVVSPAKSIATDDFLKEFEVPATQDSLLGEAENVMPVPTRKRALRQTMARPAASEKKLGKKPEARPAASKKLGKKPACQEERLPDDWVMGDQALNFMTYKAGAVALRGFGEWLGKLCLEGERQSGLSRGSMESGRSFLFKVWKELDSQGEFLNLVEWLVEKMDESLRSGTATEAGVAKAKGQGKGSKGEEEEGKGGKGKALGKEGKGGGKEEGKGQGGKGEGGKGGGKEEEGQGGKEGGKEEEGQGGKGGGKEDEEEGGKGEGGKGGGGKESGEGKEKE
ncbi:Uncharacterized protein SCF082_LOCUS19209 [Durusdinium trenchii]|uniref:Uncharacterized protein n=1 Tax=Durusdinium trenchii TaxID=1381693 RepID=A0ABP0KU80_9DINO